MSIVLPSHHTILLCNIDCFWEHTVHPRNYKSAQESDDRRSGTGHKKLDFAFARINFHLQEREWYIKFEKLFEGQKKHPGITGQSSKPTHSLVPLCVQPADVVSLQTQRVTPCRISSSSPFAELPTRVCFMLCETTRHEKFPDLSQGLFFALGHKMNVKMAPFKKLFVILY